MGGGENIQFIFIHFAYNTNVYQLCFVVHDQNPIFHYLHHPMITFIFRCSSCRGGGGRCTSRIGSGPVSGKTITGEGRISVQRVGGETDEVHLVAVFVVTFVDYVVTIRDRIRIRTVVNTHCVRHSVFPLCQ